MTKMTRKEALEFALATIETEYGVCIEGTIEDGTFEIQNEEAITAFNVLQNMIEQIDKQASRPKAKTSARTQNEKYAVLFIAALRAADKPVNATWIAEHINGVMTSQRGTHVAKIAIEWGAVQEVKIKKRTYYEIIPNWEGCEEFAEIAKKLRR